VSRLRGVGIGNSAQAGCPEGPAALPAEAQKRGRKLPNILTTEQFRRFYQAVDRADNAQHALMLRLLFYTGVRVAELCVIEVAYIAEAGR
jgi:integrase